MRPELKKFAVKIESIFCAYLGLKQTYIKPQIVEYSSNNLFVINTELGKRHLQKSLFKETDLSEYSNEDKEKLGKAVGKSIATNLIVKFVD